MNLSALTSFMGGYTNVGFFDQPDILAPTLQATNGGTVQDPLLTTLDSVNLTLDGTGTISTSQITSYTNGVMTVSGGTPSFSNLSDGNGSSFLVSGGATLSLPELTTYSLTQDSTFEATGTGSILSLANLNSVTVDTSNSGELAAFAALAGGKVTLSSLAQLDTGPVVLESDGTGSVLNVSALTSFTAQNDDLDASLQATNSGTVQDPLLTTIDTVNVTLDGTGTISTSQITSYTNGLMTVSGGTPDFSNLSDGNGSSFVVSGGATLSLPALTALTNASGDQLQALTGAYLTWRP